jgi:hypothetical protein
MVGIPVVVPVAVALLVSHVRCTQPPVLAVGMRLLYLSSLVVISLSIAATVSSHRVRRAADAAEMTADRAGSL